jgi:hypothetical protein
MYLVYNSILHLPNWAIGRLNVILQKRGLVSSRLLGLLAHRSFIPTISPFRVHYELHQHAPSCKEHPGQHKGRCYLVGRVS